jgi:hypothetical protein
MIHSPSSVRDYHPGLTFLRRREAGAACRKLNTFGAVRCFRSADPTALAIRAVADRSLPDPALVNRRVR